MPRSVLPALQPYKFILSSEYQNQTTLLTLTLIISVSHTYALPVNMIVTLGVRVLQVSLFFDKPSEWSLT